MHGDIALCEAQNSARAFFHLAELGVPFPYDRYGGYIGYFSQTLRGFLDKDLCGICGMEQ